MTIQETTVEEFIDLIHPQFKEYCGKVSRTSLEWGQWSVIMNKEIRRRIKEKTPDSADISIVYNYWVVMSQLLELKFKYRGKFFGKNKIKQKIREAQRIMETLEL